jgi:hypothetical protein
MTKKYKKVKTKKFSPYSKPYPPQEPQQFTDKYVCVLSKPNQGNYFAIQVSEIPKDAEYIYLEGSHDNYGDNVDIDVSYGKTEKVENPHYKSSYQKYLEDKVEYDKKLKQFNKDLKEYNKQQKLEAKASRQRQYEKLKKEFEDIGE